MRATSSSSRFITFIAALLLSLFTFSMAHAQQASSEPTVAQIYQAANAGDVARAQTMIDSVIEKHPNSARAHYVKAELAARQRNMGLARTELATAERLAPGLPFVKAESAQALRNQIAQTPSTRNAGSSDGSLTRQIGSAPADSARSSAPSRGMPWGMLALGGLVVVLAAMFMRRRSADPSVAAAGGAGYGSPGMGNAGFGGNGNPAPYGNQPGYGPGQQAPGMQPGPGYGQPSMGGSVMRGLGAGLAVGAGAVAAQEIGRRMFSHDNPHQAAGTGGTAAPDPAAIDAGMQNADMGGDNFGMTGGAGWDDVGGNDFAGGDSGGDVGGSDWDT